MRAFAHAAIARISHASLDAAGGIALHALHERELDRLGARLYDESALQRGDVVDAWEIEWWTEALPQPPARLLMGGVGAGRECAWLAARGYVIDAFDPAPSLVAIARHRLRSRPTSGGSSGSVRVRDYAGFVDDVTLGDVPHTYDAVVLGWGSFSHVLSPSSRLALLRACGVVCPNGPVLVSWLRNGMGDADSTDAQRSYREGRAVRLGRRIGRTIGALRGVSEDVDVAAGNILLPLTGATHLFSHGEVAELARRAGFVVVSERSGPDAPTAHATLKPASALSRKRSAGVGVVDAVAVELLVDVLRSRGAHDLVARGGSMSPAIPSGSRLRLRAPARDERIDAGAVVAARLPGGMLVVHRVVGTDSSGSLLLQGDACPSPDGWISRADVVGVVAAVDGAAPGAARRPIARWRRGMSRVTRAWDALRR